MSSRVDRTFNHGDAPIEVTYNANGEIFDGEARLETLTCNFDPGHEPARCLRLTPERSGIGSLVFEPNIRLEVTSNAASQKLVPGGLHIIRDGDTEVYFLECTAPEDSGTTTTWDLDGPDKPEIKLKIVVKRG